MKSANLSWFALVGGVCVMVIVGTGACDVSSEGLGALTGGNGEGNASGTGEIGGTSPGTGNATGQDAGDEPNTGGAVGVGGMMGAGGTPGVGGRGGNPGGGGRGGANAGGTAGTAAGGAAPNMGGMAGMDAGGVTGMAGMSAGVGGMNNTGGTNTGGATGTGGMNTGGMGVAPNDYNTQPTPGTVRCGNTQCDADEYCCAGIGPDKCQTRGKACPAGAYRGCDDQADCSSTQVCCGGRLDGNFHTGCIMPDQCSGGEVVICANSSQCGQDRLCCPRTIENMSMGVCAATCQ